MTIRTDNFTLGNLRYQLRHTDFVPMLPYYKLLTPYVVEVHHYIMKSFIAIGTRSIFRRENYLTLFKIKTSLVKPVCRFVSLKVCGFPFFANAHQSPVMVWTA